MFSARSNLFKGSIDGHTQLWCTVDVFIYAHCVKAAYHLMSFDTWYVLVPLLNSHMNLTDVPRGNVESDNHLNGFWWLSQMQSCIVWISRGLTWSDSICATPWLLDQQTQSDCAIWYMPQFCKCCTTPFYCHDFNDTHIHLLCKSDLQTQSKNTFICMSINKTLLPLNCIFAEITPEGWSQSWVCIGPDDSHQCYGWVMMQRGYGLGDI